MRYLLLIILFFISINADALNIAFVLVHDKTTLINRNQITALAGFLSTDADGDYTITQYANLPANKVIVLQILPQGVTRPTTWNDIRSYNLIIGNNTPSTNRRFWNWSIKRAIQLNARVIVIVIDHTLYTHASGQAAIEAISDNKVLVERNWGYILGPKLIEKIGRMSESLTFTQALTELKNRITSMGYTYE